MFPMEIAIHMKKFFQLILGLTLDRPLTLLSIMTVMPCGIYYDNNDRRTVFLTGGDEQIMWVGRTDNTDRSANKTIELLDY